MLITLVALGSQGDVQPFVALGLGLRDAGFRVRIASYPFFRDFIEARGLEFAAVTGNPREIMEGQAGQLWLESGRRPLAFLKGLRKILADQPVEQMLADLQSACAGSGALVYSLLGSPAYSVAEQLGVPSFFAPLQPFSRTWEQPSFYLPKLPLGGAYNRLTHFFTEQMIWQLGRRQLNNWRTQTLNLAPFPFSGPFGRLYREAAPFIYAFSETVVPRPANLPDEHTYTGYWFLESGTAWTPPKDLLAFLDEGPPPIYVGFGSMGGQAAGSLFNILLEALEHAGQRAVFLGGWANLHEIETPAHIFTIPGAPHDWLFPRMAALVHHGGAGTTAAGLRAGVPAVIVPFFGDQPYWGRRVHAIGAGPEPIQRRTLTAARLANAIRMAVEDEVLGQRAQEIGRKIRSEDGVGKAVEIIRRGVESR